jgi:hypothetical protein
MTPDHVRVRSYFSPPTKSYWRWQERGNVAVWDDGRTIAFREELEIVLARLATNGLPPLGSVLLLLAACRDNWEEPPNRRTLLHTHLGLHYGGSYSGLLAEALTGLGQLHQRRHLVGAGPHAKAASAAIVFEVAPGLYTPDESQLLVNRFQLNLAEDEFEWKPQSALDDLIHDLACLRWGLSRLDFDSLALRLKTGLDGVPRPAPVEPPAAASARNLIATLQDDPELGTVARLAQLVLAAVHLPRAISDPEELPIGGVSDIANRGPLDRLLLSELAHDDMTLAVRVALNEALFLRRESPPRSPPRKRRLLLDAGLRSWGVPRVFVTAVGLAMAAKAESERAVEAFCAAGNDAIPIDLHSPSGLAAHLAVLHHHLHPAIAAQSLISNRAMEWDDGDLVIITTEDAAADSDFQRAIQNLEPGGLFVATVNRQGRFQLHERLPRGSKLICQARFDLDQVLRPRPQAAPLIDPRREGQLPAFFSRTPVPLRFSCPIDTARAWYVHPRTVVSYTRDGRLLLWDHAHKGGRQIATGLKPEGSLLWCDSHWDGERLRLVIGKRSRHGMQAVVYDRQLDSVQTSGLELSSSEPIDVIGVAGAVLVIYRDGVEAFRWTDGQFLSRRNNVRLPQRQGRFFVYPIRGQSQTEWRTLAYRPGRGEHSIYEEVVVRNIDAGDRLLAILSSPSTGSLVGFTVSGAIRCIAETDVFLKQPKATVLKPPYSLGGVSRDECRLLLAGLWPSEQSRAVLEMETLQFTPVTAASGRQVLERPLFDFARPRVVHTRFRGLGIGRDGQLALLSHRGHQWPILFDVGHRCIRFPKQPLDPGGSRPLKSLARFEDIAAPTERFPLAAARWPDGSRAWLDGRGLLHLRSGAAAIPELTLVLSGGPLAGWLSSGNVFGPPYWLSADGPTISAREVWEDVLRPFTAQLA